MSVITMRIITSINISAGAYACQLITLKAPLTGRSCDFITDNYCGTIATLFHESAERWVTNVVSVEVTTGFSIRYWVCVENK